MFPGRLGGAWPALGTSKEASQGRIPAVARLVSRGDCTSLRADYSTLEIFQVSIVMESVEHESCRAAYFWRKCNLVNMYEKRTVLINTDTENMISAGICISFIDNFFPTYIKLINT